MDSVSRFILLGAGWMDGIGPYVTDPTSFRSPAVAKQGYGYALHSEIAGKPLSTIAVPDTTISLFDSTDLSRSATSTTAGLPSPARYGSRTTIAYASGHVRDELGIHPTVAALFGESKDRIRSLNTALLMYSTDYDHYPFAATWIDATMPYTKSTSLYRSPLVELRDPTQFGYAFNIDLSGVSTSNFDRGTVVALFDSTIMTRNAASNLATLPSPPRYGYDNTVIYADGRLAFERHESVADLYLTSQTRMRSLDVAILSYASDYDGRAPLDNRWMDQVYPYRSDSAIFHSPLVERRDPTKYGYALNSDLAGQSLFGLSSPGTTVLVFDSTVLTRSATAPTSTMPSPGRYGGKNTIGYADGHVPLAALKMRIENRALSTEP